VGFVLIVFSLHFPGFGVARTFPSPASVCAGLGLLEIRFLVLFCIFFSRCFGIFRMAAGSSIKERSRFSVLMAEATSVRLVELPSLFTCLRPNLLFSVLCYTHDWFCLDTQKKQMHSEGREKKGMFFPAFAPSSKNFKKFIV
jgi:hypothetical protein